MSSDFATVFLAETYTSGNLNK